MGNKPNKNKLKEKKKDLLFLIFYIYNIYISIIFRYNQKEKKYVCIQLEKCSSVITVLIVVSYLLLDC